MSQYIQVLRNAIGELQSKIDENVKFDESLLPNVTCRPYQVEGVKWVLQRLLAWGGCILADEMGLGKTLQSIATIASLLQTKGHNVRPPYLVVCPLSVVDNWNDEFHKFARNIRVLKYTGSAAERTSIRSDIVEFIKSQPRENWNDPEVNFDVFVTTFELVLADQEFLHKFKWRLLIVDEAQRLKSSSSKLYAALTTITRNSKKVLLTGTPIQNNLAELWALLHFILPKLFDNGDLFLENFDSLTNKDGSDAADGISVELTFSIHQVLRPFLLRRTKDVVLEDIPPLKECIVKAGLSKMQKNYYKYILSRDEKALAGNKASLMNVLMGLRKCCNHPYLFNDAEPMFDGEYVLGEHIIANSGKMIVLDKILSFLHKDGERVLIFCQMTRMLDVVQDYLDYRQYSYERLDGSVRGEERYTAIKNFSSESSFIFLLSTRAGGLGLNLTTATTVIFIDSDFNPQRDLQAQARAHRIGQTERVKVFRIITQDTVEEIIYRRAQRKLSLKRQVLDQGKFDTNSADTGIAPDDFDVNDLGMNEVIKFGIHKLDEEETLGVDDADIVAILSAAKSEIADGNENMFVFDGDDYSAAQKLLDDSYLSKIKEAPSVIPSRQNTKVKRPEVSVRVDRAKVSVTKQEAWKMSGYVSNSITIPDGYGVDAEHGINSVVACRVLTVKDDVEDSDENLHQIVGDASKVVATSSGNPVIIAWSVDNSGKWNDKGFFRALSALSDKIEKSFALARKMNDLHVGDVHLVEVDEAKLFVALMVCQTRSNGVVSGIKMEYLSTALEKVQFKSGLMKASVHMPRLGADQSTTNYYSIEKMIRQKLSSKGVPVYIYYFRRHTHPKSRLQDNRNSSNEGVNTILPLSSVSKSDAPSPAVRAVSSSSIPLVSSYIQKRSRDDAHTLDESEPPEKRGKFSTEVSSSPTALLNNSKSAEERYELDVTNRHFYLYGLADKLEEVRTAIVSKGGIVVKVPNGIVNVIVSERSPDSDEILRSYMKFMTEAHVVSPETLLQVAKVKGQI